MTIPNDNVDITDSMTTLIAMTTRILYQIATKAEKGDTTTQQQQHNNYSIERRRV